MFQGKNFKILATTALVVALSHCQGASGKRVFGNQLTTLPNQTQGASTARPQFAQQLLSTMFPSQKNTTLPAEAKAFDSSTPNWAVLCTDIEKDDVEKKNPLPDTDRDGLSDKCEETLYAKGDFQYAALDPYVYNGALIGGRYVNASDSRLDLTAQQGFNWKSSDSIYNSIGFGATSNASKAIMKKVSAVANESGQTISGFKEVYYNLNSGIAQIDDHFLASKRTSELFKSELDDENIGLAHGDDDEAIPYSPANTTKSSYNLTGLVPKSMKAILIEPIETHIILPAKSNQLDIAIGHVSISQQNRIEGSNSSLYYILNDGDLSAADGTDQTARNFATIRKSPGCETAHTTIIHLSDSRDAFMRTPSLKDNLYYRIDATDSWKPISQGMISMQPRGGVACNKTFNITDPKHKNMFFNLDSAITSRVQGLNDFNTSLNQTDPLNNNDARLAISLDKNDSGNLVDIFSAALGRGALSNKVLPVKAMDAAHIGELEKSMAIAFARGLTPEEKPLYDEVMQAIADRKAALAAPVAKVQTDPKIIQLSENGTITLDYATMTCLSKLGFAFADEQGNVYLPKEGETKKISQEVLDQILTQIGKMLDEDKITPEQVDCLLTWLTSDSMKNNPSVIKFMSDYGDKLNGLKPGEDMIRYLRKLNKDLGLGVDQAIDEFAKNNPATKAAAKKTIYDAIEKKLLDPSLASQTTLPFKDRFDIAKNLLSKKFLTDDEYAALVMKIAALKYARDFEVRKDGNLQLRRSTITFNPGTNKLKGEEAESTLAYIADAIQRFKTDAQIKDVRVQVVAHTDNTPTKESAKKRMPKNEALSKGRAQAVADFLSGKTGTQPASYAKGIVSSAKPYEFETPLEPELVIQSDHIESVGMGETQPIASNKTEAGRNKNRRVEVIILKSSK